MTNIYLAGKIAANDWRHDLVPGLRDAYSDTDWWDRKLWTPTPMYRSDLLYVGPFFISCDHGCNHGSGDHGMGASQDYGNHGRSGCTNAADGTPSRAEVMAMCHQAIGNCDVFFAWLEMPCTAYGTLVEIGFAAALDKEIVIGTPDGFMDGDYWVDATEDLWFACEHAGYLALQPTAEAAFKQWSDWRYPIDEQRAKCESPLELAFWDAYKVSKPGALDGLVVQHQVCVDGNFFRLDFALPALRIAFEMDGYTYHGMERDAFNNDRRRDLTLKLGGWEVYRFDGDLIRDDAAQVVSIAASLAEMSRS